MAEDKAEGLDTTDPPPRTSTATSGAGKDSALSRLTLFVASLVCLLFVSGLRDVADHRQRTEVPPGPSRALTVTVQGPEHPIAGAEVFVYSLEGDRARLTGRTTTGTKGAARFVGAALADRYVVVYKKGYARVSKRVRSASLDERLTIDLKPARNFEVVVVDPEHQPVTAAQVRVVSNDPLSFEALSDGAGLARFSALDEGPYGVSVYAPGFDRTVLDAVPVESSPVFVKLSPLSGLDIRTVGMDGRPLSGVDVAVAGSSLWPARTGKSDALGRVQVRGLPRGFYEVRASRGLLVTDSEVGVMLERGAFESLTVRLGQGRMVSVRVTAGPDEDGPIVSDADVALVEHGLSSFPLYGRTGDKGTVKLGPIRGEAMVSARAKGYVARRAITVDEQSEEATVTLLKGATVTGRVVDEDGFAVEGVSLEVFGVDDAGMVIAESGALQSFRDDHFAFALPGARPLIPMGQLGVMPIVPDVPLGPGPAVVVRRQRVDEPWVSDRSGAFRLFPVTPGRLRIIARHPQFVASVTPTLTLKAGQSDEVKLVMKRGGGVDGRVVEKDGQPVAGARVDVLSVDGLVDRSTFSAEDGRFAFAALPSSVSITVSRAKTPDRIAVRLQVDIEAPGPQKVTVQLPAARGPVAFRVTDEQGFSVARAQLLVTSLDPSLPLSRTYYTDESGHVVAHDVEGLPLRVVASRSKHAPSVVELDGAPPEVDVALGRARRIIGRIVSRHDVIAGAELRLLTATGTRLANSASDGTFSFQDLQAGLPRLLVVAPSRVAHERLIDIDASGQDTVDLGDIEMKLGGSVAGRVVDEEGDPVAGAWVAAGRVPTYLPLGPMPIGITFTDSRGRFRVTDIEEGSTSIEAFLPGAGRHHVDDVEVSRGSTTTDVQIVFPAADQRSAPRFGGLGGLAVTLGENTIKDLTLVRFEHVPFGGSAERAGIRAGDALYAINGVPIKRLEQARRMLSGSLSQAMILTLGRVPNMRWRQRVRRERLRRGGG